MKILKNSTYEGMCQEIEDGKKKIQSLTEQVSTERNKHAAALKEKQDAQKDFDQQLKSKSEEIERLRREKEQRGRRRTEQQEGRVENAPLRQSLLRKGDESSQRGLGKVSGRERPTQKADRRAQAAENIKRSFRQEKGQ